MIELGKYNNLKILRETSVGLFLGEDASEEEVLLPLKYCPDDFKIYDELKVFVYRDYARRKVAVTLKPKIELHEFAFLQVVAVADVGAFVDWGMEKDIMVPFKEQRQRMEEGRWYIVYLDIDDETDRLYASNKLEQRLQNRELTVTEGDEVDIIIMQKTDLGYAVIVNHKHKGLVFQNEVFKELKIGDKHRGFIKKIREDNKMDISIQRIGYRNFNDVNAAKIYQLLQEHDGFLPLNDKSSPDAIAAQFGISKKAFKKAIGALYKQKILNIESDGIKLI